MANVISIFDDNDRFNGPNGSNRQERPVMMDFFISGSTVVSEPWELMPRIEACIKTVRNRGASVNFIYFAPEIWNYIPITTDFTCNVIHLNRLYNEKLNNYRIVVSNTNITEFLSGIEPTFNIEVINT